MIGHSIPVFQGYASQYGHGLGNVLGGLVRAALPMVGKIAKAAGTKLLESGLNFVSNKLKKRKATSVAGVARKRMKTRQVKRPISLHTGVNKRKTPPGKPVRNSKRQKGARDIFA